jgi:hypothetical protein
MSGPGWAGLYENPSWCLDEAQDAKRAVIASTARAERKPGALISLVFLKIRGI